jgi:hypothetical protein
MTRIYFYIFFLKNMSMFLELSSSSSEEESCDAVPESQVVISDGKQCKMCGIVKPFDEYSKFSNGSGNGKKYYRSNCKECNLVKSRKFRNTQKGCFNALLTTARNNSESRSDKGRMDAGICTITKRDLIFLWKKQDGKCYYSGIEMSTYSCSNWQCSLERLDDKKGYTLENTVLICFEFNNQNKWTLTKVNEMLELRHKHNDIDVLKELDDDLNRKTIPRKRKQIITDNNGNYRCNSCDDFKERTEFTKYFTDGCKVCRKKYKKRYRATVNGHLHKLLDGAKRHTLQRNNSNKRSGSNTCNITYNDLVILLRDQYGKCAYSGLKLNYGSRKEKNWLASIERIDPKRGYEKDNICFICAEFNGVDYAAIAKYSNGGSGYWSKEKFNFFLSVLEKQRNNSSLPETTVIPIGKHLTLNIIK